MRQSTILISSLLVIVIVSGCNSGMFGGRSGNLERHLDVMGDEDSAELNNPQDLAFNPDADELWVVNKDDDSVSIFDAPGTDDQEVEHIVDPYALHFMEKVTSIAFGAPGTFATCQDGRNTYNDAGDPNDFTGPSLWASDRSEFGETNPAAVDVLGFDLGSHLDMLHESPQCMGIAWERDNIYWVFDGMNSSIVRYDFAEDHGLGFDDHCDGDIQRWEIGVSRLPGIPSHMVFDPSSGLLYVSDTGNDRILALDTSTGRRGVDLRSSEDGPCVADYGYASGPDHYTWVDGEVETVVSDISRPSGIALVDGTLIVAENGTGFLRAFDLTGEEVDFADTGRGDSALGGLVAPSLDELWLVDFENNELLHVGK